VRWTRIAPNPLAEDGLGGVAQPHQQIPVRWEMSRDESFGARSIVRRGVASATPDLGHSVHVEVDGLDPHREYWYRFRVGNDESPVGRTRTAPALGARPSSMAFAFASCQNYPAGFYTAHAHLAEEDLDLVVFLGDYIYNGPGQGTIGRGYLPAHEVETLPDYRIRLGQVKSDADLQAAHAAFRGW